MYYMLKGKAKIQRAVNGVVIDLGYLHKGDIFGEMAVIDDLTRSATAKAKTDVILLRISKPIFDELIKTFSHIAMQFAKSICYTVRNTNMNYINDLEKRNKQLERALVNLKKTQNEVIRLEKLSVIGKFASLIIHDIKNPMSNIRGYAEFINLNAPESEKIQKSTSVIMREVDRLNNMISELLEYTRGEMIIQKVPINISSFISTVIDTVREELKKKNIAIIFQNKSDCVIFGDVDKLTRVFMNLITNAVEAMFTNGRIIVNAVEEDKWLKWSIQDNGIGMEQNVLEKIFDPFFSFSKKEGTGLGMTIVKSIIEAHNGFIKVFSKKDNGTRFDIYLPKI